MYEREILTLEWRLMKVTFTFKTKKQVGVIHMPYRVEKSV